MLDLKKEDIRRALSNFEGVEHRLEYVDTIDGVRYINDSKATNVNSCWYALESVPKNTILILGGKDKGNDYTEIEPLVKEKVKMPSLFFISTNLKSVLISSLSQIKFSIIFPLHFNYGQKIK